MTEYKKIGAPDEDIAVVEIKKAGISCETGFYRAEEKDIGNFVILSHRDEPYMITNEELEQNFLKVGE